MWMDTETKRQERERFGWYWHEMSLGGGDEARYRKPGQAPQTYTLEKRCPYCGMRYETTDVHSSMCAECWGRRPKSGEGV